MTPDVVLKTLKILLEHRTSYLASEFHLRANARDYTDIGYVSGQLNAMNEVVAFLEEIENESS